MSGRPKVWLVSSPKFDEFPQKTLRRENLVDSDNMLDAVCGNDALLPFVIRIRESVLSAANETIENRAGDSTKDNQAYEDKKQIIKDNFTTELFRFVSTHDRLKPHLNECRTYISKVRSFSVPAFRELEILLTRAILHDETNP
eukprot:CAMPEP_0194068678 /NCGR_PEP_ID=MMETSP0009_2-20130614/87227_1 /TAXON_ID=210454 /ORGANISM="Grammatophora oceanica, Strain CCMP 410" /LENGTH=142 /DNA_ID=CAMNT_0038721799 /DNA_START=256 /DNA_END=684 /DNA_ORIENTATION=-